MRALPGLLLFFFLLSPARDLRAQDDRVGYLKVDHTVFSGPNGVAIKKLPRGTKVKAIPVSEPSHWFLIYTVVGDREQRMGYTMDPWLTETLPPGMKEAADPAAGQAQPPPASVRSLEAGQTRYLHSFSNVRAAPSIASRVVAQLPPGSVVEIVETEGKWALVLPAHAHDEGSRETLTPLGYVSRALLKTEPPAQEQETLVYVTRSGKKYHLKDCRYVRNGKFALTLEEAHAKGYEACKVCRPPKR